jgi:hypothetical protein
MSISNYAELQTAVNTWLHRSNLSGMAADFIQIGESKLNDELSLSGMEETVTLTASTSSRFLALPAGFNKPIALSIVIDGYSYELIPISDSQMASSVIASKYRPRYYSLGSQISFECVPDQAYSLSMKYVKSLDIATDLTNFLLTSRPHCYLYAAMEAASIYTGSDDAVTKYSNLLAQVMQQAMNKDHARKSIAVLGVDASLIRGNFGNVITGE